MEFEGILSSAILDVLTRFELSLLANPYICERHPVLLHALSNAKAASGRERDEPCHMPASDGTVGVGDDTNSRPTFQLSVSLARAVEALGLVSQAQDIAGPVTVHALTAIRELLGASQVSLACRSPSVVTSCPAGACRHEGTCSPALEIAIHAAINTRFELTDGATDQAVHIAIIDVLAAAATHPHFVLLDRVIQAATFGACMRTCVDASHAAMVQEHAQLVFRGALRHHLAVVGASHGALRARVGAGRSGVVSDVACVRCATRASRVALFVMHQLATLLGAPPPYPTTGNPSSASSASSGAVGSTSLPPPTAVSTTARSGHHHRSDEGTQLGATHTHAPGDATHTHAVHAASTAPVIPSADDVGGDLHLGQPCVFSRRLYVPFCEPIVPFLSLCHTMLPIAVTESISAHTSAQGGGMTHGPASASSHAHATEIVWPTDRVLTCGGMEWLVGIDTQPPPRVGVAAGAQGNSGGQGQAATSPTPSTVIPPLVGALTAYHSFDEEAEANEAYQGEWDPSYRMRLKYVALNSTVFALNAIHDALVALLLHARVGGATASSYVSATSGASVTACVSVCVGDMWAWSALLQDRICLALTWIGDGVGPHPNPVTSAYLSAQQAAAAKGGKAASTWYASTSNSGSLGGNMPSRSAGAVSLHIPQLPLFCLTSKIVVLLLSHAPLQALVPTAGEVLVERLLIRALSCPARLVQGSAVLVGVDSMQILLQALLEAQRQREAIASRLSASSGVTFASDVLAQVPPHLTLESLTKSVIAQLTLAFPAGDVDHDTVKTLIHLLSPRSPLSTYAASALESLLELARTPHFVPWLSWRADASLSGGDALRALCQTCAGLALSEAHVHATHGSVQVATSHPATTTTTGSGAPIAHALNTTAVGGIAGSGTATANIGSGSGGGVGGSVGGGRHYRQFPFPVPERTRRLASHLLTVCLASLMRLAPLAPQLTPLAPQLTPQLLEGGRVVRDAIRQKRLLQASARAFNAKPKRGIEALRASGVFGVHASGASLHHEVAVIFRDMSAAAGFHPVAIGEYLGTGDSGDDDAKRRAYAALHAEEFAGKSITTALRIYLRGFRLPGEAQMIDRILQAFSSVAHVACREGTFLPTIDATYLLSFSIIMLNTDLHNPNIKPEKKMSEDGFVRNNAYYGDEICHGRRIPEGALRTIYRELKLFPISPPLANIVATPLVTPVITVEASEENVEAAKELLGIGQPLSRAHWHSHITNGGVSGGGIGGDDASSGDMPTAPTGSATTTITTTTTTAATAGEGVVASQRFDPVLAAYIALPEVWHAALRVQLSLFSTSLQTDELARSAGLAATQFLDWRVLAAVQGGISVSSGEETSGRSGNASNLRELRASSSSASSRSTPLVGGSSSNSAASGVDDGGGRGDDDTERVLEGAQRNLANLALLAAAADSFSMHSGVDIIVSALCKLVAHSLQRGDATGTGSGTGSGGALPREAAQSSRRAPASGNRSSGAVTSSTSSSRSSGTGSHKLPVTTSSSGSDKSGKQQPSTTTTTPQGGATEMEGVDFVSNTRAQLALAAVLSIALPSSQGHSLGVSAWRWVFECITRLFDCNVVPLSATLPALHKRGGYPPFASSAALLDAYGFASARLLHSRRVTLAAAADRLSRATFEGSGGSGVPATPRVEGGASHTHKLHDGEAAGEGGTSTSGDAASPGLRSMLFGWLFGSSDPGSPTADDDSTVSAAFRHGNGGSSGNGGTQDGGWREEPDPLNDFTSPLHAQYLQQHASGGNNANSASGGASGGGALTLPPVARGMFATAAPSTEAYSDGESNGSDGENSSHIDAHIEAQSTGSEDESMRGVDVLFLRVMELLLSVPQMTPLTLARILSSLVQLGGCNDFTAFVDVPEAETVTRRAKTFFDDAAAFIGNMESARYKCAVLPTLPEAELTTYRSRCSLYLLAPLARLGGEGGLLSPPCSLNLARHVVLELCRSAGAATRRVRAGLSLAIELAMSVLAARPSDHALVMDTLRLLWSLTQLPPLIAGAARLVLADSLAQAAARSEVECLLAFLRTVTTSTPVLSAHPHAHTAHKAPASPSAATSSAVVVVGTGTGTGSSTTSGGVSSTSGVATSAPSTGTHAAANSGDFAVDPLALAAILNRSQRYVGRAVCDPSKAIQGHHLLLGILLDSLTPPWLEAGGPDVNASDAYAGDDAEDIHALELVAVTAARSASQTALTVIRKLQVQSSGGSSSGGVGGGGGGGSNSHINISGAGAPLASLPSTSLRGLVELGTAMLHVGIPTTTITTEDVGRNAADILHGVGLFLSPLTLSSASLHSAAPLHAGFSALWGDTVSSLALAATDSRPAVRTHALDRLSHLLVDGASRVCDHHSRELSVLRSLYWRYTFVCVLLPLARAVRAVVLQAAVDATGGGGGSSGGGDNIVGGVGASRTSATLDDLPTACIERVLLHATVSAELGQDFIPCTSLTRPHERSASGISLASIPMSMTTPTLGAADSTTSNAATASSAQANIPGMIRCERTLAAAASLLTKIFLHALPVLFEIDSDMVEGIKPGSEPSFSLTSLPTVTIFHDVLESHLAFMAGVRGAGAGERSSVLESLEEGLRNMLFVVSADVPVPDRPLSKDTVPATLAEAVWRVVTLYPEAAHLGQEAGMVLVDAEPVTEHHNGAQATQAGEVGMTVLSGTTESTHNNLDLGTDSAVAGATLADNYKQTEDTTAAALGVTPGVADVGEGAAAIGVV